MNHTRQKALKILKLFFNRRFISYGIFWSWNVIFAIFTFSIVLDGLIIPILKYTALGIVPLNVTVFALLVVIIPFSSIIIGITKFRKEPFKLLKLFYGIEIPLFMICLLRLVLFRELNPGTVHLYLILFAGISVYFMNLVVKPENTGKPRKILFFVGSNLLLITGVYIAIIIMFYAVPIVALCIEEFLKFEWIRLISFTFFTHFFFVSFITFVFFAYTSTVFVGMPVALTIIYSKNFKANLTSFKERFGLKPALTLIIGIASLNIFMFTSLLNSQPQVEAFRLLKNTGNDIAHLKTLSPEEKKELIENSEVIKKGLLNSYLAPYRYLSSTETNNHIEKLYKNTFRTMEDKTAQKIQKLNNFFLQPFLYKGKKMAKDQKRAEELFEFFFDTPIQKEERAAIKHAMESTRDRDSVEAGLLNINEKKVLLTRQSVNFIEHGSWAEFSVSEVYQNQTIRVQEILYYFTMPENSVLKGLWLSDEENNPEKFSFVVSPRGAAQKVYKNEVRRRIDPSLLEQVGPNQYRLRAFPAPAKPIVKGELKAAEKLYLKLSFITTGGVEKGWPMPKLSEKRNVYWSEDTQFTINGKNIQKKTQSRWLPDHIESINQIKPIELNCMINDSIKIKASQHKEKIFPHKIEGKYAVLIDPSYSMNKINFHTVESLEWIKDNKIKADIVRFDREKPEILNENDKDIIYFGSMDVFTMLKEFKAIENSKNYKAIIVLTDKGSYEQSGDHKESLKFDSPVYLVHQNRKMPPAYSDALLETIKKSKGGTAISLPEVFQTMGLRKQTEANKSLINTTREVEWELVKVKPVKNYKNTGLEPLAASIYINSLIQNTEKPKLKDLDMIHQIAKKYSIVTPYSSMIVLVNQRQKDALKNAEKRSDRFDREVEKGKEILTKPQNPFEVSGTPEPEEWLLIIIVAVLLGYMKRGALVKNLH